MNMINPRSSVTISLGHDTMGLLREGLSEHEALLDIYMRKVTYHRQMIEKYRNQIKQMEG